MLGRLLMGPCWAGVPAAAFGEMGTSLGVNLSKAVMPDFVIGHRVFPKPPSYA